MSYVKHVNYVYKNAFLESSIPFKDDSLWKLLLIQADPC